MLEIFNARMLMETVIPYVVNPQPFIDAPDKATHDQRLISGSIVSALIEESPKHSYQPLQPLGPPHATKMRDRVGYGNDTKIRGDDLKTGACGTTAHRPNLHIFEFGASGHIQSSMLLPSNVNGTSAHRTQRPPLQVPGHARRQLLLLPRSLSLPQTED
jgi:hypothetical protein